MRTAGWGGPFAHFGATRLSLLLAFVLISATTYLYVDKHTVHLFLKKVESDPYGYLHAFLVVYTLSVVLLFPCMVLQVISGALYGFWEGMLVSWIATSTGQSLAFLLGRYLFRPTVKTYLHNTWPTFPAIDTAIKKEGWKLVCLLRLSPVLPYNILNYALAITPVSFWVFTIASSVATIPWTALYVYLGTFSTDIMELAQGKVHFNQDMHFLRQVLSGCFVLVTSVYGYMLSHKAILSVLKEVPPGSPTPGVPSSSSTSSLLSLEEQGSNKNGHAHGYMTDRGSAWPQDVERGKC